MEHNEKRFGRGGGERESEIFGMRRKVTSAKKIQKKEGKKVRLKNKWVSFFYSFNYFFHSSCSPFKKLIQLGTSFHVFLSLSLLLIFLVLFSLLSFLLGEKVINDPVLVWMTDEFPRKNDSETFHLLSFSRSNHFIFQSNSRETLFVAVLRCMCVVRRREGWEGRRKRKREGNKWERETKKVAKEKCMWRRDRMYVWWDVADMREK